MNNQTHMFEGGNKNQQRMLFPQVPSVLNVVKLIIILIYKES